MFTGTDEAAIIEVLSKRSGEQRKQIAVTYKTMFGKVLCIDSVLAACHREQISYANYFDITVSRQVQSVLYLHYDRAK